MTKKSMNPSDTDRDPAPAPTATTAAPEPALTTQTATEFAQLLKSVLQSLGNGLPTPAPPPPPPAPPPLPLPLPEKADKAIKEFRRISADLQVATVFKA